METEKKLNHNINWTLVKALYLKGREIAGIAEEFGICRTTIQSRCTRENWKAEVAQINALVKTDIIMDVKASARGWQSRIDKVTKKQLSVVEKMVEKLTDDVTKKNLDKHYKLAETLQMINNMARKNLSMDDRNNVSPHVNINIMSGHNDVVVSKESPAQVLDV